MIISLDSSKPTTDPTKKKFRYFTADAWVSRDAYNFVVSRLGKFIPWHPDGWPDEVKDEGCRCSTYSWNERYDENGEPTDVWECSGCHKVKPLMFYVEWCESCGIPYVVSKFPDRTLLCKGCGG